MQWFGRRPRPSLETVGYLRSRGSFVVHRLVGHGEGEQRALELAVAGSQAALVEVEQPLPLSHLLEGNHLLQRLLLPHQKGRLAVAPQRGLRVARPLVLALHRQFRRGGRHRRQQVDRHLARADRQFGQRLIAFAGGGLTSRFQPAGGQGAKVVDDLEGTAPQAAAGIGVHTFPQIILIRPSLIRADSKFKQFPNSQVAKPSFSILQPQNAAKLQLNISFFKMSIRYATFFHG